MKRGMRQVLPFPVSHEVNMTLSHERAQLFFLVQDMRRFRQHFFIKGCPMTLRMMLSTSP